MGKSIWGSQGPGGTGQEHQQLEIGLAGMTSVNSNRLEPESQKSASPPERTGDRGVGGYLKGS